MEVTEEREMPEQVEPAEEGQRPRHSPEVLAELAHIPGREEPEETEIHSIPMNRSEVLAEAVEVAEVEMEEEKEETERYTAEAVEVADPTTQQKETEETERPE